MSIDTPTLNQAQRQEQVLTVNVNSSGDPNLEHRIFSEVHSVGRQLGRLAGVVELLLEAQSGTPSFASTTEARSVIAAFEDMQRDIANAKQGRDPERLIEQLESLRLSDPSAFLAIQQRLRVWLLQSAEPQTPTTTPVNP